MHSQIRNWRDLPGGPWRLLATTEQTGGMFIVGEARMDPGAPAPAKHVHTHEDENVYIVEGVLTVEIGDERLEARAGDFVTLPRGVPHVFANLSDELVRTIGVIAPTGIEGMFREQEAYFATLSGPPDMGRLAEIAGRYGVHFAGPPLTR
ncbi:MAG: cupin domain-containing protein [Candidatus Limnocylindria bacterium]